MKNLRNVCALVLSLAMLLSTAIFVGAIEAPAGASYNNNFNTLANTETIRTGSATADQQYAEIPGGGVKLFRASGAGATIFLLDKAAPQIADGSVSIKFDGKAYEAGIVFRYIDANNFMRVNVDWNNGHLWLSQWVNGNGSHLEGFPISEKQGAELKITFNGKHFEVTWGGETVVSKTYDATGITSAGYVGIINTGDTSMSDGSFIVKNMTVTSGDTTYVNDFKSGENIELIGTGDATKESATFNVIEGKLRLYRQGGSDGSLILLDKAAPQLANGSVALTFDGKAYEAGVVFRFKDVNNYMRVNVNWDNGYVWIAQWVNGEGANLKNVTISEKSNAELKVTFNGKELEVSWGGEVVLSETIDAIAVTEAGYVGITNTGDTSKSDGSFAVSSLKVVSYEGSGSTGDEELPPEDDEEEEEMIVPSGAEVTYHNAMASIEKLSHIKFNSTSAIEKVEGGVKFSREQGTGRTLMIDMASPNAAHGKAKVTISGPAYEAGVVFRYVDENNYSYAFVNWNGAMIHVRQVIEGQEKEVEIASALQCGNFYSAEGLVLEVEYVGKDIAININGNTIWNGTCDDIEAVAGKIGVINNGDSSMEGYTGAFVVSGLDYAGYESFVVPETTPDEPTPDTGDSVVVSVILLSATVGAGLALANKRKNRV